MLWLVAAGSLWAQGVNLEDAQRLLLKGQYTNVIVPAEKAVREVNNEEEWQRVLIQGLLTVGQYERALAATTNALARDSRSICLRWLAREVFLSNGQTNLAAAMAEEINQLVLTRPWAYRDAPSLVAIGQTALLAGADPKRVLDRIFETAKKAEPSRRDAYLASGELALDKHDFALAAKAFQEGLKKLPEDPELHFGLARSYAPSDRVLMLKSLDAALQQNTNHLPSLLLLADHQIDAEDYANAGKFLDRVLTVNPWHPEAWTYRAVVAHLQNQPDKERTAREKALRFWTTNPRVDHLLGQKLSQKYRFAESAARQRQALQFDRDYLPAKAQLSQDLLRLGEETEGWRLAEEVHDKDGYDVAAYNLVTLHETMAKFATLTNQDFVLRMSPHEAAVYGPRVLALLSRAQSNLCAKYNPTLNRPTVVEIFPEQKDFGVRTFGLPENPGFLGVCFGRVITANSPAAHPGHPSNWEAALWHEFCHVVTLQLTHNKMPRWLSEGISVYEERQANPTWGQHLDPRYREMILGGALAPVGQLSAAFLAPRSDLHLQFAYFQSALVVEFLVQHFGAASLKAILRDLGEGAEINHALEQHTAPLATIEKDFAAFARARASNLAPGLDWEKPAVEMSLPGMDDALAGWSNARPTNFWALTHQAQKLIEEKKWREAKAPLQKLIELYPDQTGADSPYRLLAAAHRGLGETNQERQVLSRLAVIDDEATEAYLRLMELSSVVKDWPAVEQNVERYLAVNPLVAPPYRYLAEASDQLGQRQTAIEAWRTLLRLDPPNPAEVHFHLAQLLHQAGDPSAKRQVLEALEEAPRYRQALQLLLEIDRASSGTNPPAAISPQDKP